MMSDFAYDGDVNDQGETNNNNNNNNNKDDNNNNNTQQEQEQELDVSTQRQKLAIASAATNNNTTSSKSASKSADSDEDQDQEASSSSKKGEATLAALKFKAKLNSQGCTNLEDEYQDALEMLQADPAMAARVAAIFRHYETTEMPRNTTESIIDFTRRTSQAFIEKAPDTKSKLADAQMMPDPSQPFYVVDLGKIVTQYAKFKKNLPGVDIHYAIKCNNSESIVSMIAALGGSFDCASLPEIKQVIDPGYARTHVVDKTARSGENAVPKNSATGGKIIFANPCKQPYHMQQAEALGVTRITFDNQDELLKIQQYMPNADAVLRIKTEDGSAVCQFSTKFGCPRSEAKDLLSFAKEIGVNVIGVSFHVGSGNSDPRSYHIALRDARELFDFGEQQLGFKMTLLDLGGGWAGSDPAPATATTGAARELSFEELTAAIRPVLYELFPLETTEIIAEPGRFFGAGCHQLCFNVHSKRRVQHRDGTVEYQYYVTDGMYGSFNCLYYDHFHPTFHCVEDKEDRELRTTSMWGPTCDSMDKIMDMKPFYEMKVGEWLFIAEFGAYTCAAGSAFNGFCTRRREYISSLPSGFVQFLE